MDAIDCSFRQCSCNMYRAAVARQVNQEPRGVERVEARPAAVPQSVTLEDENTVYFCHTNQLSSLDPENLASNAHSEARQSSCRLGGAPRHSDRSVMQHRRASDIIASA